METRQKDTTPVVQENKKEDVKQIAVGLFKLLEEFAVKIAIEKEYNLDVIQYLIDELKSPVEYNPEDDNDENRFHIVLLAAQYGRVDVLEWLVEDKGFDLEKEYQDDEVFRCAVEYGQCDVVEWIIARKDNPYYWDHVISIISSHPVRTDTFLFYCLKYINQWIKADNLYLLLVRGENDYKKYNPKNTLTDYAFTRAEFRDKYEKFLLEMMERAKDCPVYLPVISQSYERIKQINLEPDTCKLFSSHKNKQRSTASATVEPEKHSASQDPR